MIINLTKNTTISRKTEYATGLIQRGRGMIGRQFTDFDAMVFENCNSIHTMLMSMRIDVLFVTKENKIFAAHKNVAPWRPVLRCKQAITVIELPAGNIDITHTDVGDVLDLNAELSDSTIDKIKFKDNLLAETVIPFKESK